MFGIKLSVCTVTNSVGAALVNEPSVATGAPLQVNSVKLARLRRLCVPGLYVSLVLLEQLICESFNSSKSHFQLRLCSVVPAINGLITTTIDKKNLTGARGKSFSTIPIENYTQRV